MVISEIERQIRQDLNSDARLEAEQIIMSALTMTREELILNAKKEITDSEKHLQKLFWICLNTKKRTKFLIFVREADV